MATMAGNSLTATSKKASMPSFSKATTRCEIMVLLNSAVTGGVTRKIELNVASILTVSSDKAPFPICSLIPNFDKAAMVPCISALLLVVGPMPAGLTAV